jgi:ADP-ribosylglycohydrolase
VHGAAFVAALGAAIPAEASLEAAVDVALREIPAGSGAAEAVALGRRHAGSGDGAAAIRDHYPEMSPIHTLNNLALVVWALLGCDDYSSAIGDVVAAGLDTDCNGATVGGLWGIGGRPIPEAWTNPWQGRVAVSLAGFAEVSLDSLVERSVAVAERIGREA